MNLKVSRNSLGSLKKLDAKRIQNAARKISAKARLTRRKARAKKHSKVDQKQTYIPGGFGISKEPELDFILTGKKKEKKQKIVKVRPHVIQIRFVSDNDVATIMTV